MSLCCPRCGANLIRIHRRPVDRLLSLFRPVRRYNCTQLECNWTGNLPRTKTAVPPPFSPMRTPTITR